MNKPFETYNGGKEGDGTFQKIINLMPPHDIYIEAFLGNGAIYRHKKPAPLSSIGIDLDAAVIEAWKNTGTSGITLINTDAISWLEHFSTMAGIMINLGVRILIYLDPPYPMHTRKSQKDLYAHEMTDPGHIKLLSVARSIPEAIHVVISSYPNELYDQQLKGWITREFQSTTRNGTATEKIWMNYVPGSDLHDYRYLGDDYREREAVKGRINRNVNKFLRMETRERNAIIQQLQQHKII